MITALLVLFLSAGADSLARAQAALDAADLDTAQAALDEALAADPGDVDVLWAAALLSARRGDTERAAAHYQRLLAIDPDNDDARLSYARVLHARGEAALADAEVQTVLRRHPGLDAAEAIQVAAEARSGLSPFARLDLAGGYDSNLSLTSEAAPEGSGVAASLVALEAVAGARLGERDPPLTGFLRLRTTQTLTDRTESQPLAPTSVGGALTGRLHLGEVLGSVDMRWDEVFSDSFDTHQLRLLMPSLSGALPLGTQTLRLLVGLEHRTPFGDEPPPSSATLKASVRDTLRLGRVTAFADLGVRKNDVLGNTTDDVSQLGLGFLELRLDAYAEVAFGDLTLLGAAGGATRSFPNHTSERTLETRLGARYSLGTYEVHLEHAFTNNLAPDNDAREFQRHAVYLGVRAWL